MTTLGIEILRNLQSPASAPGPLMGRRSTDENRRMAEQGDWWIAASPPRVWPQPCAQWPAVEENNWMTSTPARISPMPIRAAASRAWPCQNQAMAETSTMPAPDQMA